jgi:hypothetical protein
MIGIHRSSQRFRPKLRSLLDVIDVAVDQNAVDARAMHIIHSEGHFPLRASTRRVNGHRASSAVAGR